jgi:hypothetical protein
MKREQQELRIKSGVAKEINEWIYDKILSARNYVKKVL